MARNNVRKTLNQELENKLFNKNRMHYDGKHDDKNSDRNLKKKLNKSTDTVDPKKLLMKQYFHSDSERDQYMDITRHFCKWGFDLLGKRVPVDSKELLDLLPKYLEHRLNTCSPYTVYRDRAALSKAYIIDLNYITLPTRGDPNKGHSDRNDSNRSDWNKRNKDDDRVRFWEAIGRRRAELEILSKQKAASIEIKRRKKEEKLPLEEEKLPLEEDGTCINIKPIYENNKVVKVQAINTKGGKGTIGEIPDEDIEFVTKIFNENRLKEMLSPTGNANVHDLRRAYARKLYKQYARPYDELIGKKMKVFVNDEWVDRSVIYRCRNGHKGEWYDRNAVARVSKSLGHSDQRCYDVIKYYLRERK